MGKVSVVIPFFRNVNWLKEAIESVLGQTYENYEIIVINDGSKENLETLENEYGKKIRFIHQCNKGPAAARNKGIEFSTGSFVAFLDSDDVWVPQKLEVQVQRMAAFSAVWSYCGFYTFGVRKNRITQFTHSEFGEIHRHFNPSIATPTVMVKKEFFLENSTIRFCSDLRFGQDSLLWYMINARYPILAIPEILVGVRTRRESAARNFTVQVKARAEIWEKRKENPLELIEFFHVGNFFRIGSEICVKGNKFCRLTRNHPSSFFLHKLLSTLFFILAYPFFKLDKVFNRL